jgi:hypothetical protein
MRDRISSTLAMVALGMGTLLASVTVGWSHSNDTLTDQVHACIANESKVVRIVGVSGSCISQPKTKAETAIHWPATATPPPASGGGIRVVDSSVPPKTVGLLISTFEVAVNANGTLVGVNIQRGSFGAAADLFYELADCAGPGFFIFDDRLPPFGRVEADGTLTYPDLTQVQQRLVQSYSPHPGQCVNQPDSILGAATLTSDFGAQSLTPPFSAVAP